jgi:hypothetical protein
MSQAFDGNPLRVGDVAFSLLAASAVFAAAPLLPPREAYAEAGDACRKFRAAGGSVAMLSNAPHPFAANVEIGIRVRLISHALLGSG